MILERTRAAWDWVVDNRNIVFGLVVGFVLGQLVNSALALEDSVEVLTTQEGVEAEIIDAAPPIEDAQEDENEQSSYEHAIKRDSFVKAYAIVNYNSI